MGLFDQFPYTNFHELNLMWILKALKEIQTTTEQFVAINSLKYADPIQWNIVSQYEKNTIVIDPLTGTAYISVQPVPTGVALTNTDYWTVVFDLGSFVTRAAKNFTDRWESQWTQTATFPSNVGDWLVWNDTLYKVISNIVAGDQYVIDSNIQHFTMEELYNDHVTEFTLKILNILGSIGVNELDSTVATRDLNAGVLVWVNSQLHMTLVPITTGTTFIEGTNITPVSVNDFILDRINNSVNDLEGSIAINELDSTTATVNIPSGNLVWVNDQLYMSLIPISVGDTFVVGTNITGVNVNDFVLNRILNTKNDLKGSIAINELDSTTATVNIPSGNLVWVNDQLYMSLIPISVGDTFVVGTNITGVNVNDFVLDRINTLVSAKLVVTNATDNPKYLTVGSSGCNFTSINAAITYARSYATLANRIPIFIMSGKYNEEITLLDNPGIDLIGIGDVEINYASSYPNSPLFFTGSIYCENITFLNTNASGGTYGIHYEAQNSPTLEYQNIKFKHCTFSSYGHAGAGIGMGSGDVATFEDCIFETWTANRPALLFHNYPADSHDQNFRCIRCRFNYQNTIAAIRVTNVRAIQGNPGTSNMSCQFISCTSKLGYNYIDYVYNANDDYQGYLPLSGEVTLNTLSGDNDILGLNIDDVSLTTYHAICATNPNNSGQYVAVYLPKANDYDVTLYHVSCMGTGFDITSYCSIYNKQNNQIIINSGYTGADYANGVDVTLTLSPAKSSSLVP